MKIEEAILWIILAIGTGLSLGLVISEVVK